MKITKLDLGDTLHGYGAQLGPGWTSVDLDPRREDEPPEPDKLIADYAALPFKDAAFDFLYGGCWLEMDMGLGCEAGDVEGNPEKEDIILRARFKEAARVLKVGGRMKISSCSGYGDLKETRVFERHVASIAAEFGLIQRSPAKHDVQEYDDTCEGVAEHHMDVYYGMQNFIRTR